MSEPLASSFNWIDIVLGFAFLVTLFLGLSLGFYRQVALAAALTLGLALAGMFTDALAGASVLHFAQEQFGPGGARMLAYLTLLGGPIIAALASFLFFPRLFGKALRLFDTLLGGVIGLSSTVLLFWLVLYGSVQFESNPLAEPVKNSYLGSRLAEGACYVAQVFPDDFRARMDARFREAVVPLIEQRLPDGVAPPEELPGEFREDASPAKL